MTDDFRNYLNQAANTAGKECIQTEEYKHKREKVKRAYEDLTGFIPACYLEFVKEYCDILTEPIATEASFMYIQGYLDCVQLLKTLGVI